jgi:hypothetical protein
MTRPLLDIISEERTPYAAYTRAPYPSQLELRPRSPLRDSLCFKADGCAVEAGHIGGRRSRRQSDLEKCGFTELPAFR